MCIDAEDMGQTNQTWPVPSSCSRSGFERLNYETPRSIHKPEAGNKAKGKFTGPSNPTDFSEQCIRWWVHNDSNKSRLGGMQIVLDYL